MGAEPYLVASVIEGLLAQRLGRKLCPNCLERGPMPEELQHRLAPDELERFDGMCHRATGCDECGNSGFYGRIGFFELITISSALRRAIAENQPTSDLRRLLADEFIPMREDGICRALEGVTTVEEVLRATQDTEDI